MPVEVVIPSLGMTMEEGTITQWLKHEGDHVEKEEPLFILETDKVSLEVEASIAGTLAKILAPTGTPLPVGKVVALILAKGESPECLGPADERTQTFAGAAAHAAPSSPVVPTAVADVRGERLFASPLARRVARELNVDLAGLVGTGPSGRIVEADVRHAAAKVAVGKIAAATVATANVAHPIPGSATQTGPAPEPAVALNRYRRITATRMAESARTIPSVTLFMQVEMDEVVRFYQQLKKHFAERDGTVLAWDAVFIKAVAMALRACPYANAQWAETGIRLLSDIHIGFAVALDEGLVVPVVRNADQKSLVQVARSVNWLAAAARESKLGPDDVGGATFTITNLGKYDVMAFTPIINPPEAGILGIQFFCAQQAIRHILEHGREQRRRSPEAPWSGGSIVNISSVHAFAGVPGHSIYAGTKGAINAFTRELAVELCPAHVRVNVLAPGPIEVPRYWKLFEDYTREAGNALTPWKRIGLPADVAYAAAFLISDAAEYITGQVIYLDGGMTAKLSLPVQPPRTER